ncbi:hypothetical protein [Sinisalibacter aestuarii]|uniref:hypothetical protein n=1 Tax=Sinisalibacter aestuarii TaxID=2949426 RepID=UPI00249096AB|nr:hypothetical protein [Sinisalibacter aestuarii]
MEPSKFFPARLPASRGQGKPCKVIPRALQRTRKTLQSRGGFSPTCIIPGALQNFAATVWQNLQMSA